MLEETFVKYIIANAIILFAFVFYIFLFYKIKIFSPIYVALKKNHNFFLLILVVLLVLSFFNEWKTHIPYDEQEHVIISMFISKNLFFEEGLPLLPRPLAFPVFLSFLNIPSSYYFSQFIGRLISFLSTFLSAILLFVIYEKLGVKKWMAYLFTFLFTIASYNIFYSTLNKPEAFAVCFTLLFIYLFWEYSFNNKKENFWVLYFLSLFLPLIRFELIVISFSFLLFLFFKLKHKKYLLLIYLVSISIIFIFSYSVFSGGNTLVRDVNSKLFDISKLLNSFLIKMVLGPWLPFFVLFFVFIFKERVKSSSQKQRWFFNILLFSFMLLSLLYSFYLYSDVARYQKMLYPFLFLGLFYLKDIDTWFKNKKLFVIFIILLIIFYSFYFLYVLKGDKNLEIAFQPIILSDEALSDISANIHCFNRSLIYTSVGFIKLIDGLNVVTIPLSKDANELISRESRYPNIKNYIYLLEYFSSSYGPINKLEILSKASSLQDKISQLCPELKNETKRYLIYLDKPLSEYLKD